MPRVNKKTISEKAKFCPNTVFSLHFKFRAKKIHAANPLTFSLHFLYRHDQNHYSNLTSKIMKMCEQTLKERQRPNTTQSFWIVKNFSTNSEKSYHASNSVAIAWANEGKSDLMYLGRHTFVRKILTTK